MPLECPKCGSLLASHAVFCSRCAAEVSTRNTASPTKEATLEAEIAKMERELKESTDKVNRELEQRLGPRRFKSQEQTASFESHAFSNTQVSAAPGLDLLAAEKTKDTEAPGEHHNLLSPREIDGFLFPLPTRIHSTLSAVLHCPHVLGNLQYRVKAGNVHFQFDPNDNQVNAFASAARTKEDAVHPDISVITYLAGIANIIRVTAACVANHHRLIQKNGYADPRDFKNCIRSIGERMEKNGGHFATTDTLHLTKTFLFPNGIKDETIVTYAQNYTEAMERFVLAHELGHICYGHVLGSRDNFDISRMQERDADSFAAQCASSDTHRETSFLGQLFVTLIFTWVEERVPDAISTTHPAGRERFHNAIHSNPTPAKEALETLKMSIDDLLTLLP